MNKYLQNNLKVITVPALSLLGVILVFLLAGSFVWGKISDLIAQYNQEQQTSAMLKEKLNSLQSTGAQISDFAQSLTIALPQSNSSLTLLSQAKSLASQDSLNLQNIKGGSEVKESGTSHAEVSFDVEGSVANIFNFVSQTKNIAPINKVTRVKLSSTGSLARANITINAYWASLPTKIPAVSDPLAAITPDEQKLLQDLSSLTSPQLQELSPSAGGGGRSDPFSH